MPADVQGLEVGAAAPGFRAESSHGRVLESSAFRDKVAMVVFLLPDIESAGSLDELQGWNDLLPEFGRRRIQVLGVAPTSAASLMRLVDDRDLSLTLVADKSGGLRSQLHATHSSRRGNRDHRRRPSRHRRQLRRTIQLERSSGRGAREP